jgi:serine/threonine protein kinase
MAQRASILYSVARTCPELQGLPNGWTFDITNDAEKRILFEKSSTGERTFSHPTLGGLPRPWVLKIVQIPDDNTWAPMYFNRSTRTTSARDPRYMRRSLSRHSDSAPRGLEVAASTIQNTGFDLSRMQRSKISERSIRHKFEIVHIIDAGDGTLGGMNGGVFVVRMKGLHGRIFIEKRFKQSQVKWGQKEIEMIRRVRHDSLTFYNAAFVTPSLSDASLYVEFCDWGSLRDLMENFAAHFDDEGRPYVPEAFVWHVFTGLCDGLAYLQSGESYYRKPNAIPKPGWVPILHRDIKPDNILLRSRHTLGSKKYFYCVLSDFGLASELRLPTDPKADKHQKSGHVLGSQAFWAPELLHDNPPPIQPRGRPAVDFNRYPDGNRHSPYSDVWALGCTIYNLCTMNPGNIEMNHIDIDFNVHGLSLREYRSLKGCRIRDLRIPDHYSKQLRTAIRMATVWHFPNRPFASLIIRGIELQMDESGITQQTEHPPLPEWATKVHEYLSEAERLHG